MTSIHHDYLNNTKLTCKKIKDYEKNPIKLRIEAALILRKAFRQTKITRLSPTKRILYI